MTDHTKQETTAMDRIEIAKAIYHAAPRNKPFDKLSAFKRERLIAEADAFLASLSTAGYRILGPDEVDPVTLDRAELACFHQQSKIHDRKRTDWDRGNDSAVNGCIAAIRAIGRKA